MLKTVTIKKAHESLTKRIECIYPDTASSIAWWLLEKITAKSTAELIAHANDPLSPVEKTSLATITKELCEEHKPLQYILGSIPFLSLEITVRPPILIPRPETEYWCSVIIEQLKNLKNQRLTILDLCTGSGCIALAFAQSFPQAYVYAVDLSPLACALAGENAQRNNITNITIVQSDLFSIVPREVKFDLIVSNPPYISPQEWTMLEESVRRWEDTSALVAEQGGLALLKKIIQEAPAWLSCNKEMGVRGIPELVLEIGSTQGEAVSSLCREFGYREIMVHEDQFKRDRFVTASICE
jgi:release factor glutamine methyltransferase